MLDPAHAVDLGHGLLQLGGRLIVAEHSHAHTLESFEGLGLEIHVDVSQLAPAGKWPNLAAVLVWIDAIDLADGASALTFRMPVSPRPLAATSKFKVIAFGVLDRVEQAAVEVLDELHRGVVIGLLLGDLVHQAHERLPGLLDLVGESTRQGGGIDIEAEIAGEERPGGRLLQDRVERLPLGLAIEAIRPFAGPKATIPGPLAAYQVP